MKMMEYRYLSKQDIIQAYRLDKKWFGSHGMSKSDLEKLILENAENTLVLVNEKSLLGFAVFEILEGMMPKDYLGKIKTTSRVLFIQQFTTSTNYAIENCTSDSFLLEAVEKRARELHCKEVWEALSKNHPYKKENNAKFDAFGFYESHGFLANYKTQITWQPSESISIPCYMFMKRLE